MVEGIETARLILRPFAMSDLDAFAGLHGDADVMGDVGGPISRAESRDKLAICVKGWEADGLGRWHVARRDGTFLGYVGIAQERAEHPLGPHYDIGWRLHREAWGMGYALEAAQAALRDAFLRVQVPEVFAYTSRENLPSQAVIAKLPFERIASLDFSVPWQPLGQWHGLVWRTDTTHAADLLHTK